MNPKDKKLILDFLNYIEQPDSQTGYILMDKGNWRSSSMFFNEIPKPGDKTKVRISLTMERPTLEKVDDMVDLFLKKRA
tara:strand:+ start:223 stop:459 length:237 start_codon:yes stop_codon:yes gene_type:complete